MHFYRVAIAVLCLAAPWAVGCALAEENRDGIAVIIGNKTYRKGVPAVEFAHNDAAAIKRHVVERLGFRAGNIIDLRDAGKSELEAVFGNRDNHQGKAFQWVRAGRSDLLVYYSGHGVPGQKDGRGYLLPSDADPDTAELNGYPLDVLLANLASIPARSVTVFLDACFSGLTPGGALARNVSSIGVRPAPLKVPDRVTVVTAATGQQMASWDLEARHGLFTAYLLKGLGGAADADPYGNGDGKVTLGEIKAFLDDEMTYRARRQYTREQTAEISGDTGQVLALLSPPMPVAEPAVGPSIFYDLPEMLVNLNSSGKQTFLKIRVALEVGDALDITRLEQKMPALVDSFQVHLRALRIEDLQGASGLYRLREQLLARANNAAKPVKVQDVLFKEMLVQ